MSGFSTAWLSLREAVDHRSRDHGLELALGQRFASRSKIAITDIGCGTGSNLRATFAVLPHHQEWTLVDLDRKLLDEARAALIRWSNLAVANGEALHLRKSGKEIVVRFCQADLNRDLDEALGAAPDLVTASAFFDLASVEFMERFAAAVAKRKAASYSVLTYNGIQTWTPAQAVDGAMAKVFHAHQGGDKGFGPAAGPAAPQALRAAFVRCGYRVFEADSPWLLDACDRRLLAELERDFSGAVSATGVLPPSDVAGWAKVTRSGAVVGHTDTLSLPA